MALELTGLRAVIENISVYLADSKRIQDANKLVQKSQEDVERTSKRVALEQARAVNTVARLQSRLAREQIVGDKALARARATLVKAENTFRADQEKALTRLAQAKAKSDSVAKGSDAARLSAARQLATAEAALLAVRTKGQATIANLAANVTAVLNENESRRKLTLAEIAVAEQLVTDTRVKGAVATVAANNKLLAAEAALVKVRRSGLSISNIATKALSPFVAVTRVATVATTAFGKALIAMTGFQNRFAVALRFGIAAVTAFTAALSIGAASQFEQTLARVDVLTEATAAETDKLGKEILELSRTIPKSPNELGAGAYFVLSSGIKNLNLALEVTEVSAKAATVGLGTTEQVARTITAVINAYGDANISAAAATDVLVAAVQQGSIEAADFTNQIGRLLGIAPKLGIEFDELASALATLSNFGLRSEQATTALLGIMNQLISPAEEAKDTLVELGTSIEEVRKNISERGLLAAMQDLLPRLNNNIQAFEQLFPEVRGLGGALLLFSQESSAFNDNLQAIRNSAGITDEAFKRMSETFDFQINLLKNQLNRAFITIGQQILPLVVKEVKNLTAFLDRNQESIKNVAKEIVTFTTNVLKDFAAGIKVIVDALAFIPDNQLKIVAAVTAIGIAMAVAFGPASAAVIGAGTLITLFGVLERKSKGISDTINKVLGRDTSQATAKLEEAVRKAAQVATTPQEFRAQLRGSVDIPDFIVDDLVKDFAEIKSQAEGTAQSTDTLTEGMRNLNDEIKQVSRGFEDQAIADADKAKKLTDALSDGIITFAEAVELGLNAIQAGALEASVITKRAEEEAFDFSKTLSLVANAFNRSRQAAEKLVLSLQREALAKISAAEAALFGRPTREVAILEEQLAQLDLQRAEAAARIIPQIEALQDRLDALEDVEEPEGGEATTQTVAAVIQQGLQGGMGALNNAAGETAQNIDELRKSIQDEIDALQRVLDLQDRESGAVQRQIDIYQAQSNILQKQIQLADATLETQASQTEKAKELAAEMGKTSKAVVELANRVGEDVIPEFNDMALAIDKANKAFEVLDDEGVRKGFISNIDAASLALGGPGGLNQRAKEVSETMAKAAALIEDSIRGLGQPGEQSKTFFETFPVETPATIAAGEIAQFGDPNVTLREMLIELKKINENLGSETTRSANEILSEVSSRQHGGVIRQPEIAQLHPPEVIIPLREPQRAKELIGMLPPSLFTRQRPTQMTGSLFGDIVVNGQSWEENRRMIHTEIDRRLDQQRRGFRSHGL